MEGVGDVGRLGYGWGCLGRRWVVWGAGGSFGVQASRWDSRWAAWATGGVFGSYMGHLGCGWRVWVVWGLFLEWVGCQWAGLVVEVEGTYLPS
jgi:hypothetical protein